MYFAEFRDGAIYFMEYVNDLRRKTPQDRNPLGKLKDATAIIPDRLTFRWWQLLCAVSVGNIVLWSLAAQGCCGSPTAIDPSSSLCPVSSLQPARFDRFFRG